MTWGRIGAAETIAACVGIAAAALGALALRRRDPEEPAARWTATLLAPAVVGRASDLLFLAGIGVHPTVQLDGTRFWGLWSGISGLAILAGLAATAAALVLVVQTWAERRRLARVASWGLVLAANLGALALGLPNSPSV